MQQVLPAPVSVLVGRIVRRAARVGLIAGFFACVVSAYWTWQGGFNPSRALCHMRSFATYQFGDVASKHGRQYCWPDLESIVLTTVTLAVYLFVIGFVSASLLRYVHGRRPPARWPSAAGLGRFAIYAVGLALLGAVLDTGLLLGNHEIGAKILCPTTYAGEVGGLSGALAGTCNFNVAAFFGTVLTSWAVYAPFAAAALVIAGKLARTLSWLRRHWHDGVAPTVALIDGQAFTLALGRAALLIVRAGAVMVLLLGMMVAWYAFVPVNGHYVFGFCDPVAPGAPYRFGFLAAISGDSYCLPDLARIGSWISGMTIFIWFLVWFLGLLVVGARLGLSEAGHVLRPTVLPRRSFSWRRLGGMAAIVVALALLGALIHSSVLLGSSPISAAFLCPPVPSGGCNLAPWAFIGTVLMTALASVPFAVAVVVLALPAIGFGRRLRARPVV